ncbi:MAG: diguanylate cyclase [Actinomycetota bacterium]|nr:diguanylate cyclase [Actinomycetota bacterium]
MTGRTALPRLMVGVLGLAAGMIAFALDERLFGAVAGVLALASSVATFRLAQQLTEQSALQRLVEDELRTVRNQAHASEERLISSYDEEYVEADEPGDNLTDPDTGLFSESFFNIALESRIAAARRHLRPVAVVLLEVVQGLPHNKPYDADAELVAESIRVTLREADTACRLRNGYFALLLEDTPENGAIWTVERIRRQLLGAEAGLTLWAGVACYPAHAFGTSEIMSAAESALISAREWRQDRIEVATVASD